MIRHRRFGMLRVDALPIRHRCRATCCCYVDIFIIIFTRSAFRCCCCCADTPRHAVTLLTSMLFSLLRHYFLHAADAAPRLCRYYATLPDAFDA